MLLRRSPKSHLEFDLAKTKVAVQPDISLSSQEQRILSRAQTVIVSVWWGKILKL